MAMLVRKASRGVNGDCNRHHLHKPSSGRGFNPANQKAIPLKQAMWAGGKQSHQQQFSPKIESLFAGNTAIQIAPSVVEDVVAEDEAAISPIPAVKLATDNGHDVRDDESRYERWKEEFAWTSKARAKSVVSLIHPDDKCILVPVMDIQPVLIHGIPLGTLKRKSVSVQQVPTTWMRVRMQHMKNAANSRRQAKNNVTHKAVSHYQDQLVSDDSPPWDNSAANDSVKQVAHVPTIQPKQLVEARGFMEDVNDLRRARQEKLRQGHIVKGGFMLDVTKQLQGEAQYHERLRRVHNRLRRRNLRAARRTVSRREMDRANHWLGENQYSQRAFLRSFLKQHGESVVVHTVRNVTDEQATALQSFAVQYPVHLNRDFWKQELESEHPDYHRTVTSCDIIRRAELQLRTEDRDQREREYKFETERQELKVRHWLRSHSERTESVFTTMIRKSVIERVTEPSHKEDVSKVRQLAARRVAAKRDARCGEEVVVSAPNHKEDEELLSSSVDSKLILAGQAPWEQPLTHTQQIDKICLQHGMILPFRVFDTHPAMS